MGLRIPSLLLVGVILLAGCAGVTDPLSSSPTESMTAPPTTSPTPQSTGTPSQHAVIWAQDDITLTVQFTAAESNETVYNETHSISGGEELEFNNRFEPQPYRLSLIVDGETILREPLGTCTSLRVSIDAEGNAIVIERGAGDC